MPDICTVTPNRLPQVYQVIKTNPTRNMSLFPRGIANDLASFRPMFQLMDDYANHMLTTGRNGPAGSMTTSLRSFAPRFDIKENKENNSYELHGELPGVQQKDINIEFTDPQTISIKGRTEYVREEGERPAGFITEGGEQTEQTTSNGHEPHKATVEDEAGPSSEAKNDTTEVAKQAEQQVQQQQPQQPKNRYWLSERSVGTFSRQFSFPDRVDADNVKASLKDGILSIVVPKATAPTTKRIQIQ
ncbi:hypothetical protein BAUCODRAFT_122900 [Baudoinia panamericana UAMH 10762]|uniref:SHSP domain-containing protein n=1 Tax=Baudoinia panamericana (strain UAMH 10762) TaxID=717646 RepID=M2MVK9_BAUPA|nr:uncharacterized protein BAUCODRAFT_122900 [Baudoinia panamericana UAMH 10762]EMC95593.1 hypothetical protein BAUCODRAFT_122900 [Baudoinia panamericana UAMH 10762]